MIQAPAFPSFAMPSSGGHASVQGRGAAGPDQTGQKPPAGADADRALTQEEQRQVQQLKRRDQEVRAHERAHMAAGAGLVRGGASYTFQRGPDGRMYAVGGEVQIDTSSENDPDQTIRKMQQVKQAALAPSQPSGTDRSVAAQASQIEAQARQEKRQLEKAEAEGNQQNAGAPSQPDRRPYEAAALGLSLDITA